MSLNKPENCVHCGCSPDAIPLCEHLTPIKQEEGPREQKILFCPACPIYKYKWYQFKKKSIQRLSSITPMINIKENEYKCRFCTYGYKA